MGELTLSHGDKSGAIRYTTCDAAGEVIHLCYAGTIGVSLTSDIQSIPVTLVRASGANALTGTCLVDLVDKCRLDYDEIFEVHGRQDLPFSSREFVDF